MQTFIKHAFCSNEEQYYIGLKCTGDGQGINLGIFTDEECMAEISDIDDSTYASIAYQDESFVTNDCISCGVPKSYEEEGGEDEEDAEDEYYDDGVTSRCNTKLSQVCAINYDESTKCEVNMNIDNPDYSACDLINNIPLGVGILILKTILLFLFFKINASSLPSSSIPSLSYW